MSGDFQMTYRYLRKKKWEVALALVTIVFLYVWTDGFGSSSIRVEPYEILRLDLKKATRKRETTPEPVVDVDILNHLRLRQALRNANKSEKSSASKPLNNQFCRRPHFDLKHDSVKYAFFPMKKLNCSREELFSIINGIFTLNSTKLGSRQLEKCMYFGIDRVNDDFSSYTEPLTIKEPPFDIIVKHDFVRIKCFLKEETDDSVDDVDDKAEKFEVQNELKSTRDVRDVSNGRLSDLNVNGNNINGSHQKNANTSVISGHDNITDTKKRENKTVKNSNAEEENNIQVEDKDKNDENIEEDSQIQHFDDYDMYNPFYNYDYSDTPDFDQLLVHVQAKADVFQRISKKATKTDFRKRPNVLMFGLDSMSHLAYQRKLPKTYKYLKEKLGSVILDGYNIVGDATTAALIPILTGKTEIELPEVRRDQMESGYVDSYPLIWNNYKKGGYVTMFAEDEPSIGVFNLRLNGFQDQPTDHYMRPFWLSLWNSDIRQDSPRYCSGNTPNHMYLLQYTKDFFDTYANVSKFAFVFGSELTHWDNNPGEYADENIVQLLEYFRKKGYLDNTILIMYADHGARYSRVRNTVQGKMEERLPMMSLALPPSFKQNYPKLYKNLHQNSNKLATPFDIHETLLHVLHLDRAKPKRNKLDRGVSLLDQIPQNRTCSAAHIDMHWCTCLKQFELDASDAHVQKSINTLLTAINKETQKVRGECARLKFKSLHHAYLVVPNEKVLMFRTSKDVHEGIANFNSSINIDHAHFQITIETIPNNGLYESTVQVNMTAGTYTVLESQISRLDRYGSQPACIQDKYPSLRKYCFCRESGE